MNIWHPFERIPDGWPTLTAFVFLAGLSVFAMLKTKGDLKTDAAPHDAISLEFAGSEAQAKKIIDSWKPKNESEDKTEDKMEEAYRHLRWDSRLFIPAYSTLIALACVMAARALFRPSFEPLYGIALAVAWLPWLAGLCDYAENGAMYAMLGGSTGEAMPRLSWWAAAVKFGIIIPLFVYGVVGALVYVVRWLGGAFKPIG
jgi:hypothetical protein